MSGEGPSSAGVPLAPKPTKRFLFVQINGTVFTRFGRLSARKGVGSVSSIGTHCLLELYGCPAHLLDDHDGIIETLRTAAEIAGATWLSHTSHRFSPQGVTAVGLLSESHISIHTWPESGYAAADVFTCGDHTMPEKACLRLLEALGATHYTLKTLSRALDVPTLSAPLDAAMAPG